MSANERSQDLFEYEIIGYVDGNGSHEYNFVESNCQVTIMIWAKSPNPM